MMQSNGGDPDPDSHTDSDSEEIPQMTDVSESEESDDSDDLDEENEAAASAKPEGLGLGATSADRISQTNIQPATQKNIQTTIPAFPYNISGDLDNCEVAKSLLDTGNGLGSLCNQIHQERGLSDKIQWESDLKKRGGYIIKESILDASTQA